jgi:hypothetical protein
MKPLLCKLRRLLREVVLMVQLLLWLMGLGTAAEPVQTVPEIDPGPTAAPARTVPTPDPAGVSPGPPIG